MKIRFYLRYSTQPGESLSIVLSGGTILPMVYLNAELWYADLASWDAPQLQYHYHFHGTGGYEKPEYTHNRYLDLSTLNGSEVHVMDYWDEAGAFEQAFLTQPFQEIFFAEKDGKNTAKDKKTAFTHQFQVKAPLLAPGQAVCLLGHGTALRNWDSAAPLLLRRDGEDWTIRLDLSREDFPLGYKYGVWDTRTNNLLGFENGSNRPLYAHPVGGIALQNDGFVRLPNNTWRGAGVAIPVFSLRTSQSFGVGEFTDLPALADWAGSVGLKLLQLLPINDTSATGAWTDSYPYAAVSAFALHPIYLNAAEVAGKKHTALLKPFAKKQKALNALDAVDYEGVLTEKWAMIRLLFEAQKDEWRQDRGWQAYFEENRHWLVPYAAFCYLKTKNGTADFNRWSSHRTFSEKEVTQLVAPDAKHHDEVAIHYFVQWHLHRQLKAAADYAHARGLALKGDIPIGIYRYSCDAWMAPELYHMDQQAGAPPDDFAVAGQNWGFPTYNWARMKADDFAWWRQRFAQMSLYFDAFRIDHILGFFRIWSIPLDAVQGILGRFVPALPVREAEFHDAGIGFSRERLCRPFVNDTVLNELFGELAPTVRERFLDPTPDGGHWSGKSQYSLKPGFDTQRKVEQHFEAQAGTEDNIRLRDGLYDLIANVVLLETPEADAYAFRINMDKTASFRYLPEDVKAPLKALYVNYFYRRQDDFWQIEALEKLPELKRSTRMLICGEDLGMVPDCVPGVMRDLGMLSLEIQRMPKQSGSTFFNPKDAPYLAVVTPSTHDMSTIRGWWEENQELTRRFFNEQLGYEGTPPFFCEPWIARAVLAQHFHSPAMWAIFQIQDLLSMDGALRRENPQDERINVPANPKHYWQYRMHLSLEELAAAEGFNGAVRALVESSGR